MLPQRHSVTVFLRAGFIMPRLFPLRPTTSSLSAPHRRRHGQKLSMYLSLMFTTIPNTLQKDRSIQSIAPWSTNGHAVDDRTKDNILCRVRACGSRTRIGYQNFCILIPCALARLCGSPNRGRALNQKSSARLLNLSYLHRFRHLIPVRERRQLPFSDHRVLYDMKL